MSPEMMDGFLQTIDIVESVPSYETLVSGGSISVSADSIDHRDIVRTITIHLNAQNSQDTKPGSPKLASRTLIIVSRIFSSYAF